MHMEIAILFVIVLISHNHTRTVWSFFGVASLRIYYLQEAMPTPFINSQSD